MSCFQEADHTHGAALLVESHRPMHPMHARVGPRLAELTKPIKALPEPPTQFHGNDHVEGRHDLDVSIRLLYRPVIRRP
jgi:hypothetical protein